MSSVDDVSNQVYKLSMATPDVMALRATLGTFATGVTIVTCEVDGQVHGATVNSFTAVSLDPPLVLACLSKRSKACTYLRGRNFTVNILAADQQLHALHFAGRKQDSLVTAFEEAQAGPRIQGCVAYVSCLPWKVHDAGDHDLILGEVADIEVAANVTASEPLLFYRGGFWRLGSASDSLAAMADVYADLHLTSALSW
jgi:flavin reductase (DIM6/NTAB) family NADH-FMN oxidoreductase RutF